MKKTDLRLKKSRKFSEKLQILKYLQSVDPIKQKIKYNKGIYNLTACENELNRLDNKIV